MKLPYSHNLKAIANLIDCKFIGNPDLLVTGINEIHQVEAGDLVFVDNEKYYEKALTSAATTILIDREVDCPEGKALIISENPFRDFNKLTEHFSPVEIWSGKNQEIRESVMLFPNVSLGDNVKIGKNSIIYPGVVIYSNTVIGENVIIHANTVIGGDAFYFQTKEGSHNKLHSCGSVQIDNHVEIGASCSIDKGVSGITKIGEGTKIDGQVHIGHDTVIGKHCRFAAQVGIAGCVTIEDNVTLWGQVGIPANLTLHKNSTALGQAGILKNMEEGKTYLGSPAKEAREEFKEMALIRKLPQILGLK
ncbi:UDP-3-O-(3-hydroxymyristoyl)glucosamine N-acyltransferase [Flavobacteriales bacterium]|nr:UDP-3-O-(3-hydroxymyristoyl)glucosamine N-acyltransferase [bacterium]MDA9257858.1 UDP-3-O-(3-hydroxymyristoyl)glucosamine N-acyltransferase [bacterium]MDB9702247.1 UDP-3-O-(3-hydroxymyristoyl)glucosamine N-acyltransferase [Flavobacteriales bacterium]MDC1370898.1 UDP-3-O-(3-hydroxymyristoyl)glucosamine N-acyltransferase [Flavobacteriales bacterium]